MGVRAVTSVHDHATARTALAAVAGRTQGLLAELAGTAVMADSQWTVGDVGAHLLITLRGFTDAVSGDGDRWADLAPHAGSFHDRLAAFNARTIAEEPPRDLAMLGARVVQASQDFLAASAGARLTRWCRPSGTARMRRCRYRRRHACCWPSRWCTATTSRGRWAPPGR